MNPNEAKPQPGTTDFQSVAIKVAVTVDGLEVRRTEIRALRSEL